MELYQNIMYAILSRRDIQISFPELRNVRLEDIIENFCYLTLEKIINIMRNDNISDEECFQKIEEIIKIFEKMDIPIGRHDFV